MADRRPVAVPDPRGDAQAVWLSGTTHDAKRKILGLNSAKLYGIKGVGGGMQRFKPVQRL